ncbi:inosine monophosphate dehydrogenase [Xylona heveae TC161]|uniref:Inosine monophosphate dehydrogenase n=1 Tax=Xylona heveae (strain CBS 132557 / TC161) TaxID=1328760 RepID=A0A164Z951_XYLHT|nr:inosine monophosphate dehydrogenase [Xylona heveae TC161]KZF18833.1 inosine monophosphate dehydrogenase [Xylona heveae TC161]
MASSTGQLKRKRSRVACEPCRERKRKCNGGNPCLTCTEWGYDCFYKNHHRAEAQSSLIPAPPEDLQDASVAERSIPDTVRSEDQDVAQRLEANSGAAFVRKLGLKVDPEHAPKLNLFGWNIGARQGLLGAESASALPSLNVIPLADMRELACVYFAKVDPCYGFIDSRVFYERLDARWRSPLTSSSYDSVLAGVAALGSLFSTRNLGITEHHLVKTAQVQLETELLIKAPCLDTLTGWTLRVIYMRMTASPYPAWIASCTLMHLIEAAGFHLKPSSDTVLSCGVQCDPQIRGRLIGVAQHLNMWISYDLGLSMVPLHNENPLTLSPREGDYTTELLNLLPVSSSLAPDKTRNDTDLQSLLLQILNGAHSQPPSVLAQCNLVLCLLRRLRALNSNLSSLLLEKVLALFKQGLCAARTMAMSCNPWHHVANVPFHIISILLEMDSRVSFALLPEAMQTLRQVANTYNTATMREAHNTACLLIFLYQRRRSEDPSELRPSPRQMTPSSEGVSWLEGLVSELPNLQGFDFTQFLQDMNDLSQDVDVVDGINFIPLIVSAPMRVMSGPVLAVAVSRAGGLGFIGPGVKTQDMFKDLEEASALVKNPKWTARPPPVNSTLPVGIAVSAIRQFKPCAAWLYAPREGQKEYDLWSTKIRKASPHTQIWIQIGTLAEAVQLVREGPAEQRPDIIVVQGAEAGGHGRAKDGMGLMTLFPEVADALAHSEIPLFAAGGITDGRGAAAALCLGASGIVMGTRFLASTEARISRGYQNEIIRASDAATSTTKTLLYNHLRGTMGWPEEYSPRTIINRSFIEHQKGSPFEELKKLHDESLKAGDSGWGPEGRLATYAGAGIGLIHEVKDAAAIVRETQEGVRERLSSGNKYKL